MNLQRYDGRTALGQNNGTARLDRENDQREINSQRRRDEASRDGPDTAVMTKQLHGFHNPLSDGSMNEVHSKQLNIKHNN
ncbi:hypothetical protein JYU34_018089 [Plutella xylostella]|uniref:Uncharacterized protein n=1 Tax=Plutella xylostella TaxID=51655 RepID=A0ABQ7Q155_PLUXY|nr:hypothetical protein JYU34_018089 [Plutella xylostella]